MIKILLVASNCLLIHALVRSEGIEQITILAQRYQNPVTAEPLLLQLVTESSERLAFSALNSFSAL